MVVDALAEPTRRVSGGFLASITVANIGILISLFTPIQNLLPRYAELVAGAGGKETALAWISGAGAFASIVVNPVAGALSDRTTSRLGRRRPWLIGGALLGAALLVLMSLQTSILGLALVWALVQGASNAALAGVTAYVPDQVPVAQRGLVSGLIGMAQVIGVVLGLALVSYAVTDLQQGVHLVAALLLLLPLALALTAHDARLPASEVEPFRLGAFVRQFWISPREHPDFAWAWITRFLMWLGTAMVTLYLLFYLKDGIGHPEPEKGQTLLTGLYGLGTILTAVIGGRLSDRSGKRKVYVVSASLVMAAAALVLAWVPTFEAAAVAALVLGLGYGVYLAVDQALITQVLPSAGSRARDLGVINIANASPQVLAPVIAAPIVTSLGGYPALYTLVAVVTALAGILVRNIVSVP
ncbi:MAG: MFS transporter [Candidatus Nanopelagicales bacterium]|nr:MFS transporter [Candidatus Nanopelagicales bacterium]